MIPNLNVLWAEVVVGGLAAGGVRHACLSPGSRSAPLAIAFERHEGIAISIHLDERSAAFFALGIARATRRPVALLCTSGTAAANYLPAVIEASQSTVPLVILTADRPPELRQSGAAQTIDQIHLYGRAVRAFQDLPLPEPSLATLRAAGAIASYACAASAAPVPGPVHLNVPFREPLSPVPEEEAAVTALADRWRASLRGAGGAQPAITPASASVADGGVRAIAAAIRESRRGLIVSGPEAVAGAEEAGFVLRFAQRARLPILADAASGLRFGGGGALCHADAFLRSEPFAAAAPDLVIRIGRVPTSRIVNEHLARHRPTTIQAQPDLIRRDPDAIASHLIQGGAGDLFRRLSEEDEGTYGAGDREDWMGAFRRAEEIARGILEEAEEPLEAAATREAIAAMPEGSVLFLSSSMPIRWAETYCSRAPQGLEVFVSRGANGIDGITSAALGVAVGRDAPLLLVTGDLAFLHDLEGLLATRLVTKPFTILLLDNDGGGIFSHLPIAQFPDLCLPLFNTPHGLDLEAVVRGFGIDCARIADPRAAAVETARALSARGVRVLYLRTDRDRMARGHRELLTRVGCAVRDAAPWPGL